LRQLAMAQQIKGRRRQLGGRDGVLPSAHFHRPDALC
jgi:hypothetical protein